MGEITIALEEYEMLKEKSGKLDALLSMLEEYKQLIEKEARINAFAQYVNSEKYSIGRDTCARFFGFEVEHAEE